MGEKFVASRLAQIIPFPGKTSMARCFAENQLREFLPPDNPTDSSKVSSDIATFRKNIPDWDNSVIQEHLSGLGWHLKGKQVQFRHS